MNLELMKTNNKKDWALVGAGKVGKTTALALTTYKAKKKENLISPPTFDTEEEERIFMEQTKPIPLDKLPEMPKNLRTLGDYVQEYSKIQNRKSLLSGTQRIVVKNIIHNELRTGNLILTPPKQ